ncbi:unnamed protein product [Phytophthora fragariaefolia]|uniref:Unnamed protein product n=1 Tax=Phytophthora fragariaefolia TaxID=1490495 RepID=A0A9W6XUZ4_9STRA|nr:unnamed protein product [Phytophthora fragariaefolia]
MVRVPRSSGDLQGFHRESTEDDVKIKTEPGNELSTLILGFEVEEAEDRAQEAEATRDANEPFDMEQSTIRETMLNLFARLAPIEGSVVPVPQEVSTPTRSQAGSSQYASATSEARSGLDSCDVGMLQVRSYLG